MNCIQPIAPAELGPMFWPKFDSTLLIAASTCHGTPYAVPACCQIGRSSSAESRCGWVGGVVNETGTEIEPGEFGVEAVGRLACAAASCRVAPVETVNPITGGCA